MGFKKMLGNSGGVVILLLKEGKVNKHLADEVTLRWCITLNRITKLISRILLNNSPNG